MAGDISARAHTHALEPSPSSSSLNLATLTLVSTLAVALAAVVLALTRLLFLPPKRTLSVTELNTLLNRRENGGTGVRARKWRKRFLPPPTFGDEDVLAGAGLDAPETGGKSAWSVRITPAPPGLRSCLKRAAAPEEEPKAAESNKEPLLAPRDSAPDPPPRQAKQVRVVEPSLVDLDTLRTRWASPGMQGEQGLGGVGGYRSTRDFYARGKGGSGVVKRDVEGDGRSVKLKPGKVIPAIKADDADEVVLEDSGDDSPARRLLRASRLSAPSQPTRASSNSPSPLGRRRRALSPPTLQIAGRSSSPVFIVGATSAVASKSSPSRRRPLSPTLAVGARAQSASPGPSADRAGPRWVKTRNGKLASPAPIRMVIPPGLGESDTEEDETVSEGEYESESLPVGAGAAASLGGIAAVAAAIPPYPSDASIIVNPTSPTFSILSGGESPQESPTPALATLRAAAPKVATTPSSPPAQPAPPLPVAPGSPASPTSPSSASSGRISSSLISGGTPSTASTSTSASSTSTSPSPSVSAERRLSLRVEQALRDKRGKRRLGEGSPGSPVAA